MTKQKGRFFSPCVHCVEIKSCHLDLKSSLFGSFSQPMYLGKRILNLATKIKDVLSRTTEIYVEDCKCVHLIAIVFMYLI